MTPTSISEELLLLPLTLPHDAHEILRLHYQVHTSDPIYATMKTTPQTESEFITTRLASTISQLSSPNLISSKLVPSSQPSKMVSYIVFNPPEKDDRTEEEKDQDLRKQIEGKGDATKKELVYELKIEDRRLNERFLGGKGYEGRWWTLDVLVTDQEYQRRGLGTRLVKWGLEKVEEDVKRRNGELENEKGDGEKIQGCYLIASPQGARTYEKAGFVKLGGRDLELGKEREEEKYMLVWFVKRFE